MWNEQVLYQNRQESYGIGFKIYPIALWESQLLATEGHFGAKNPFFDYYK